MEKRNFYRLKYQLTFDFMLINPETIEVISSPQNGTIIDLSGGGLSFTSNFILKKDDLLELKIINEENLLLLIGKIVRIQEIEGATYYDAEFVHLDQKTQDKIIKFIFSIQRRERLTNK